MTEKPKIISPDEVEFPEEDNKSIELIPDKLHIIDLVNHLRSIKVFEYDSKVEGEILNKKLTNDQRKKFFKEVRLNHYLQLAREKKMLLPFEGNLEIDKEGLVDIL